MKKEVLINGGLRAKKAEFVLTIYSTPLARLLIDKKIKGVNVKYESNLFVLEPGDQRSITIERKKEDHPLPVLRIAMCIPNDLKSDLRLTKKQKKTKILLKDIATKHDLSTYNKAIKYKEVENLNLNIPISERIKVGCHISCFKNKKNFNYRLNIRHRILEEIAIKKEKVAIARNDKGEIIIRKNKNGSCFNFYKDKKGHPLAYMQISPNLITSGENSLFGSGKRCISLRAFLSGKEFDLDVSKFFMTKDERELAYALMNRNISIRIPEMRKREADIVLKSSGIQIEVTHLNPRKKENNKNSPHTEGVHINARLCEGYLRVTKKITPLYFVVFNEKWNKYKWVNDLISTVKPHVICITTDFKIGWEEIAADKIEQALRERNYIK